MSSASKPPSAQGGIDLPPAPGDRWWDLARRWWRSRGRHRGLRRWLLSRGVPILSGYVSLYVASGLVIGWRQAYDVNIGIQSPADTSAPVLAWFLSVAGWLVAPGVAGAVAGYVVSASIASRRKRPVDRRIFPEADDA